jgi:hypothetical protein
VAIDGETLRGGLDEASGESAIHLIPVRATANRLGLGRVLRPTFPAVVD